jgi:hypothetical protein
MCVVSAQLSGVCNTMAAPTINNSHLLPIKKNLKGLLRWARYFTKPKKRNKKQPWLVQHPNSSDVACKFILFILVMRVGGSRLFPVVTITHGGESLSFPFSKKKTHVSFFFCLCLLPSTHVYLYKAPTLRVAFPLSL